MPTDHDARRGSAVDPEDVRAREIMPMHDGMNTDVSRRGFLHGAAAVGAGAMAGGLTGQAFGAEGKLPTKVLGRTKLPVTKVSYGSLHTSGGQGGQVLKLTIRSGVNMVHNSSTYRGGNAIRAMGDVFKKNKGMRDKLVLCLKGKLKDLEGELDTMLKDLHTDHCEVYLPTLHEPDEGRLNELMTLQDKLKKQGKIRFTGFVCHGALNNVFEMVLNKAPKYFDAALLTTSPILAAKFDPASTPDYIKDGKLAEMQAEAKRYVENLTKLKKNGLGVISMKSYAREAMAKSLKDGDKSFQAHCKALLDGGADTVLFTFGSLQQAYYLNKLNLAGGLTEPEERLARSFYHSHVAGACMMCGKCTRACPNGVPVSDLMRIRMYHEEHHDCGYAAENYGDLTGGLKELASRCGSCTACADACPVGLACAEKVRHITSLYG